MHTSKLQLLRHWVEPARGYVPTKISRKMSGEFVLLDTYNAMWRRPVRPNTYRFVKASRPEHMSRRPRKTSKNIYTKTARTLRMHLKKNNVGHTSLPVSPNTASGGGRPRSRGRTSALTRPAFRGTAQRGHAPCHRTPPVSVSQSREVRRRS